MISTAASFVFGCLAGPQEPAFVVRNPSAAARNELVRASLPLPRGRFEKLPWVRVAGDWTPTVPLIRWPDGSLAVVQLQPRIALAPGQQRRFRVDLAPAQEPPAAPRPAVFPVLQGGLPLETELTDPWGAVYRARFVPAATAGPNGYARSTSRVRVRRFRAVHRLADETGERRFFELVAYLTTFAGERRAELTVVLANGAHDPATGPVLGPARFRGFALVVTDARLKIRPRFIAENNLRPPVRDGKNKKWRQQLLGPSDQLYLGDRTAKVFRFDLFLDGVGVAADEREKTRLATDYPLRPIPDVAWVRHTRAFGAHGGPAPGPGRATAESVWMHREWLLNADYGPFGAFGDPKDAAVNGTPRNGPSALHNVLRYASSRLLGHVEGIVLQHCLRPTPGYRVRIPDASKPLRQGMSKRTLQRPHGFTALDYEHFSVDLLYDYYWLTGDLLARDEILRMGRGLPEVLQNLPFRTCRGEGWCMQAAVLIARATGDDTCVATMHKRFRDVVEPELGVDPAPYVIRQPPHEDALDGKEAFDCPWQMAAFVHGAHAMFEQTSDPRFAKAAVRAGRVMAGPGWLEGEGPKYLVSAMDASRYTMPVGFGPLEGTALMEVSGFVLAAELARKQADRDLFRRRIDLLMTPYEKVERARTAMNAWFQLALDRRARKDGARKKHP